MSEAKLSEELLQVIQQSSGGEGGGASDEQLRAAFGSRYSQLEPAINELLAHNRLQLFTDQSGALVYKAVGEEIAIRLQGLG